MMTVVAPIKGSSGLDKSNATTALEDGFSADALGMLRETCVGLEILAIIGADIVPITVWPDGGIGYEADGSRWRFCRESRGKYYGRWGMAERQVN